MNKKAQKIREDLAWQVAFAREARARESEDGRYIPQFIAPELLDAIAVMFEKWGQPEQQLLGTLFDNLQTRFEQCSLSPDEVKNKSK